MHDELEEQARRFQESQEAVEKIQEQLQEARSAKFGTDSPETEERAREFFAGVTGKGVNIEDIDELEERLQEAEAERDDAREELWDLLKHFKLPLDQTIKQTNGSVKFPYDRELALEVIDSIEDVLTDIDLTSDGVEVEQDAIIAHVDDVEEAMDMVQNRIEKIRASAEIRGEIEHEVEKLHDRDPKLKSTLYVLYREDSPLTKAELEDRISVEDGALRGVLYYSAKNDEYLSKKGQEFSLSELGRMVMDQYDATYEPPTGLADNTETDPDTEPIQEELA